MIHKWTYGGLGILILGLLYLAHAYSVRQAKAEVQQSATAQIIAVKDQALADLKKEKAESDAKWAQAIADVKTGKQGIQILQPIISPQGQPAPQAITKADLSQDAQKAIPGPPETPLHVLTEEQIINAAKRELGCQKTEGDLTRCETEKSLMQAKIDALTKANAEWVKAGAVPKWTAGLGIARAGGSQGYTPALFIDYRIQPKWGLFAGAENKAVFAGVSVHFGSQPK